MATPDAPPLGDVVRFGAFEIDLRSGELRKSGVRIRLQDQPFRVLRILLEHRGALVTREELQRRIWPSDTFVDFDRGLNNAVKRLREALGDEADTPRYIETVPKHGYRFIGDIREATSPRAMEPVSVGLTRGGSTSSWKLLNVLVLIVALLALVGFGINVGGVRDRLLGSPVAAHIQSLAVIPLTNLSADQSEDFLADGITDALITELSHIHTVRLISRTSVMRYKRTTLQLPQVAHELNVDAVVEGTLQRAGDRVRITVQLIHAASDRHLWASSYERDLSDVFGLERDLAGEIARQVQAKIAAEAAPSQHHVNVHSLEAYLEGKQYLERVGQGFGDGERKKAASYFQTAIDLDQSFAQAYGGLAESHCYSLLPVSPGDRATIDRANQKAAELDPTFSPSYTQPCSEAKKMAAAHDLAGAETEYGRCIALDPNNPGKHRQFANFLDDAGRLDDGWKEHLVAQELDPKPMAPELDLPAALVRRGRYDEAIAMLLGVLVSEPNEGQTHLLLVECYRAKRMRREEIEELGKAAVSYGDIETAPRLRRAFDQSGYTGAMREWAASMAERHATGLIYAPTYLADIYRQLNDRPSAFRWLEMAFKERDTRRSPCSLDYVPEAEMEVLRANASVKTDPQFRDLLQRLSISNTP